MWASKPRPWTESSQCYSFILLLPLVRPGANAEGTRGLRTAPHPGISTDKAEEWHSSQADLVPIRMAGFSILCYLKSLTYTKERQPDDPWKKKPGSFRQPLPCILWGHKKATQRI